MSIYPIKIIKKDTFSQKQIEEESVKARLVSDNIIWNDEICKIEKHSYFSGQIGFILEFCKIDGDYDLDSFVTYTSKLSILYGSDFKDRQRNFFQRELLTFSDCFSIKKEEEYYYILESENGYVFGFCDGYSNQQGLDDMEQHVKAIIKKKQFRKIFFISIKELHPTLHSIV